MKQTLSRQKRKFHDAWAFFAYVICLVSLLFMQLYQQNFDISFIYSHLYHKRVLFLHTILIPTSTLVIMLSLYFFPKVFLHFGFICTILAQLYFGYHEFKIDVGNCITHIFCAVSIAVLYLTWGIHHIRTTAIFLRAAIFLVAKYFAQFFTFIITTSILIHFSLILLYPKDHSFFNNLAFYFQFYWSQFVGIYILYVITCTIISNAISNRREFFMEPLKNMIYSIGTICLGALLVAIVSIVQYIIPKKRSGHAHVKSLFSFIIDFIEDVIIYVNKWTFVSVSLKGESYRDAAHSSMEKCRTSGQMVLHGFSVDILLGFPIYLIFKLIFVNNAVIWRILLHFNITHLFAADLGSEASVTYFTIFFISLFSVFSAAVKTLAYIYSESPNNMRKTLGCYYEDIRKVVQ